MEGNTYLNSYGSEQTNINPLKHMNELKNFRMLKNLGSLVHSVRPFNKESQSGFQVMYY